ncbi:hypothetical protein ACWLZS_004596 [Vibrio parahaemolyticus]|nr:hypothetical protein [Vibrio parahaemolyticus]HCE3330256.1 hypothetical protein [Vibrio parahaemolyticus]HCE3510897.1 hypothetical protein [Vibrio parahaemolyticus]HCG7771259.1 hypothetical protein [Vibrio parahaemolyticus]
MSKKSTIKFFSPEKGFFELGIVRGTGAFILLSFVIGCFLIHKHLLKDGIVVESVEQLNGLLVAFKLPLAFLALSIPIGAIFAANHRSEQTKAQISLSTEQNKFTNYYKHLEEFEEYCKKIKLYSDDIIKIRSLHNAIFPLAMDGSYVVTESYKSAVKELILSLFMLSAQMNSSGSRESYANWGIKYDFCNKLSNLDKFSGLISDNAYSELEKTLRENGKIETLKCAQSLVLKALRDSLSLASFDTSFALELPNRRLDNAKNTDFLLHIKNEILIKRVADEFGIASHPHFYSMSLQ